MIRPNGHGSEIEIEGGDVTTIMLEVAEELLTTLTTGERPPLTGLYDLCARAFGTTREDAKQKLTLAVYAGRGTALITTQDRRRIADGDRALALPDPNSDDEIRQQLTIIFDGMLALQSLDDLGEEGNRKAFQKLEKLQARHTELTLQLQLLADKKAP
jgi:hypothetical protein